MRMFSNIKYINPYSHEIDTFNGSMKCGSEIPYSISHVNIFEQYKEEKSENLGLMKTYLRQNTLQTTSKWSRYPIVSQRRYAIFVNYLLNFFFLLVLI